MNKNQKAIRRILAKEGSVNIQVPAGGYHNSPKGAFQSRSIPTNKGQGFKKKQHGFPTNVNDNDVTLMHQREVFFGLAK